MSVWTQTTVVWANESSCQSFFSLLGMKPVSAHRALPNTRANLLVMSSWTAKALRSPNSTSGCWDHLQALHCFKCTELEAAQSNSGPSFTLTTTLLMFCSSTSHSKWIIRSLTVLLANDPWSPEVFSEISRLCHKTSLFSPHLIINGLQFSTAVRASVQTRIRTELGSSWAVWVKNLYLTWPAALNQR